MPGGEKHLICVEAPVRAGCAHTGVEIGALSSFDDVGYLSETKLHEDLVDVTADYSLRDDGGILVTNRGRNTRIGIENNRWIRIRNCR